MLSGLSALLFIVLCIMPMQAIHAEIRTIQTKDFTVSYEERLANVAAEVAQVYPVVSQELVETLKWEMNFRPKIILTGDRDAFRKIVGMDIIAAFALPDRDIIVIDTSRVYTKPFTLRSTLKHELCHLLLHRNIDSRLLPRWIDEGVCQWASGGVAELMADDGGRILTKAAVSDRLISIRELARFPMDEPSLILAYEESKNIIEYIVRDFGKIELMQILENLKEGDTINESVQKSLGLSLSELESKWHASLKRKYAWFAYLSANLYTIIFALAALITVYGFIRLIQKKRAYKDDEEEEEEIKS
ncbi:MAG: hypothetical protein FJ240_00775 [Nitrospira sp.]|nr:hypothetical protein [Nitrospira sp.]